MVVITSDSGETVLRLDRQEARRWSNAEWAQWWERVAADGQALHVAFSSAVSAR